MKKSNLLVIFSDEHNPMIAGFAGDPFVSTPNLDKLAKSGSVFTSAYCNSPICVPARASLATGLYTHQTRYWDNAIGYDGEIKSWGHVLQEHGVRVESIGKLHYKNDQIDAGFDRQQLAMHIKGPGMLWGLARNPLPVFEKQAFGMLRPIGAGDSAYNQYDRDITRAACGWLRDVAEEAPEEPWVLFVGLVAPHFPLTVPQQFIDPYLEMDLPEPAHRLESGYVRHPWLDDMAYSQPTDDGLSDQERKLAKASYYGLVSFMDHNVGQILSALASAGLTDSTRIVYASDHGENLGARGLWGKGSLNDESAGVPMIVSGPDVPKGAHIDTPVSLVDLYPTVLQGVGLDVDASADGDDYDRSHSRSLFDLANAPAEDRLVLSEYHAVASRSAAYMLRNRQYKFIYYVDYKPELFDMLADPTESDNLAQKPEFRELVSWFEQQLRGILNPEEVDAQAKADQQAVMEQHGGMQACLSGGVAGATPIPKLEPHEQ